MTDNTIELLNKYLDSDYRAFPLAPTKSTPQDIENLEQELEVKFPEEYVMHLLGDGDTVLGSRGIYIEVIEEIWRRPKPLDVAPFWMFLYGLHSYTACKESEDWMRLDLVTKEFRDTTGIKGVPILKIISDADMYCLDEKGQIGRYNHELNEIEKVEGCFWTILEYELKELAERKAKKVKQNAERKK